MARPVSVADVNYTLIKHVMQKRDLTVRELHTKVCRRLSIKKAQLNEGYFYQMLRGEKKLNEERLAAVSFALGVDPDYFRTSLGRLMIRKAEADLTDFALAPERFDAKELQEYLDISERLGHIDFAPDLPDTETIQQWDFWKRDTIVPFRSEKAEDFWQFTGDEILVRGPARCGKSTLTLEWIIAKMFQNPGMQVLITRAFAVDLDAVRQNIIDLVKYKFTDPLSSIRVIGGKKFHTVEVNGGEIHLKGIDRPGGLQGAGFEIVLHSQAEQIKKENIDYINSRCTPAANRWMEQGVSRSMVIYDANPNRLDHWIEAEIKKGLAYISFDFVDHPAYFTQDGEETELFKGVYGRLSKLEGVVRQRLLEGKPANPEGTIFELEDCHKLAKLPDDFATANSFYRGFDFGMKDPNVILWFAHHRATGDIINFREWRMTNTDTIVMGEAAKNYSDEKILATVQDNDENLQRILLKECGIPTILAQKGPNSITSGITLAQHRLQMAREGKPGGLYFYNNPVVRDPQLVKDNEPLTTVDEADLYSWHENSDKPIDKYNHGWDIIRYMLDYLENRQAPVGFGGTGAKRQRRNV